uniref:Uncharacterized protein n=1 Tax=Cacopsylla melanoneura TaxID=428564 RepID=A0A8D8SZJ1_9HEMI
MTLVDGIQCLAGGRGCTPGEGTFERGGVAWSNKRHLRGHCSGSIHERSVLIDPWSDNTGPTVNVTTHNRASHRHVLNQSSPSLFHIFETFGNIGTCQHSRAHMDKLFTQL